MDRSFVSLSIIACLLLGIGGVSALPASLVDQGTGVTYNGAAATSGTLGVLIWTDTTSTSSTALVFNQSYTGAIINGSWSVILNDSVLDLEFGKKYYKDYTINDTDLDYNGVERLPFYSSVGAINSSQLAVGTNARAPSLYSIALGFGANASNANSVALGVNATTNASNQLMVGGTTSPLNTIMTGNLSIATLFHLTPTTAPASGTEGDIFFSSVLHKPCYYNSSAWVTFDGVSTC